MEIYLDKILLQCLLVINDTVFFNKLIFINISISAISHAAGVLVTVVQCVLLCPIIGGATPLVNDYQWQVVRGDSI